MKIRLAILLRILLLGLVSGGGAFLIVLYTADWPPRIHAFALFTLAVLFAISEYHLRGLLSELGTLLRRGTYSVWQLEKLDQMVPKVRKQVTFIWIASMLLKGAVAVASALLLWDGFPPDRRPLVIFFGYALLIYSIAFALWGHRNFIKLERAVDKIALEEAGLREKRRLIQNIESGTPHDFANDKLASGYTNPPAHL